jgi:arylsulfatase A-like enzyme
MAASRAHPSRRPSGLRRPLALALLAVGCCGACLAVLAGCGGSSGGTAAGGPSPLSRSRTAGEAAVRAVGAGKPNIVFVLTDDLAWNLVRYMPHVLRMQREGETFDNYFVSDSLCCPSRASILTGRLPHDTRVYDNSPPEGGYSVFHQRGEERETFALALQRVGYRTALMGKYLNGYKPAAHVRGNRANVPPGWSEWDVAGNGYPEYGYRMNSDGHSRDYGYRAEDYLTDVLARKALAFVRRSRSRPFLLELATFAPHAPYTPAPRDAGSLPGVRAMRSPAFNVVGRREPAWLAHFAPLDSQQIDSIDWKFRRRAQAVQAVDRMIGALEAELRADGVARDTYIVFSSDNGLHMGEHRLRPGKLTAFDTDIKVPLIVTGPGVPAGRTVGELSENIDLCPSFEQLGGAPVPASVDGHSLLPLLRGRRPLGWRRAVLIEHHGRVYHPGDPDLPLHGSGNPPSYEAIRTHGSLYVEYATGEREYYDLRRDPFELDNIVAALAPQRLRRLHRTLIAIERCHGARACWRAERGAGRGRRLAP